MYKCQMFKCDSMKCRGVLLVFSSVSNCLEWNSSIRSRDPQFQCRNILASDLATAIGVFSPKKARYERSPLLHSFCTCGKTCSKRCVQTKQTVWNLWINRTQRISGHIFFLLFRSHQCTTLAFQMQKQTNWTVICRSTLHLAMKDLSFRSMPSLELHQQKVVYGLWQSQLQKMNRPPGQDEESGIPMNFNETW